MVVIRHFVASYSRGVLWACLSLMLVVVMLPATAHAIGNCQPDTCTATYNGHTCEGMLTTTCACRPLLRTYYRDRDGDGHGDPGTTAQECLNYPAPSGYIADNTDSCDSDTNNWTSASCSSCADSDGDSYYVSCDRYQTINGPDCNDSNGNVHPGATEVCNGIDDNCNGTKDEGVKTTFYRDSDSDSYGVSGTTTKACSRPSGYASRAGDCNDSRSDIHPGAAEVCNGIDDNCNGTKDEGVKSTFYHDGDGDHYGDASTTTQACSAPANYVADNTDCDDTLDSVHPGATEVCNGIDDNCNGTKDEGVKSTFYHDGDGDQYGDASMTKQACTAPANYVADNTDCDDTLDSVHPGATEVCNGIDDNCDGTKDEGVKTTFYADADNDSFGNSAYPTEACTLPTGYADNADDCDDTNDAVNPDATEDCGNGIDDNCDGKTDVADATCDCKSGNTRACYSGPTGTEGVGPCIGGTESCVDGQWSGTCDGEVTPAAETCDGTDDNCDGNVDENGADCAADQVCNAATCEPACTASADCPGGTLCYPDPLRCLSDACADVTCGADQVCAGGSCFATCTVDSDCDQAGGESCYDGRCAAAACDGMSCAVEETCYSGTCFQTCSDSSDCASGTCIDGRCADTQCAGVICATSEICDSGQCVPRCQQDADCTQSGATCTDGRCVVDPCAGVQCDTGEACFQGTCYATCANDADCGDGYVCNQGACVVGAAADAGGADAGGEDVGVVDAGVDAGVADAGDDASHSSNGGGLKTQSASGGCSCNATDSAPGSLAFMALVLAGLGLTRRRRR